MSGPPGHQKSKGGPSFVATKKKAAKKGKKR